MFNEVTLQDDLDHGLTPLGRFLEPELEDAYQSHIWDKKMLQVRTLAGLFAVLEVVLSLVDVIHDNGGGVESLLVRAGMVVAAGGAALATYRANRGPMLTAIMMLACLATAIGTAWLAFATQGDVFMDLAFVLTVLVTTLCFVPLDGRDILACTFALGVLYLGPLVATSSGPDVLTAGSLFCFLWGMGAMNLQTSETQGREMFLLYLDQRAARRLAEAEVAQRARVEVALRKATADAEAASKAKSAFLATMSHEIRTPLNGILGLSELMEHDGGVVQPDRIADLRSSAQALRTLLEDVLDLSRMEARGIELHPQVVSVRRLAQECVSVVRHEAESRGLELRFSCPDDAFVRVDEGRLRQVLLNQLTNAVKFTTHGYVGLSVRMRNHAGGVRVEVEVEDTGPGIAPEDQRRVLEPFTQVDSSSSRPAPGAGLGLAICVQILEAMGSELKLHSELGEGTRFSFSVQLPLAERQAPEPRRELPKLALHVLVVDDEPVNRKVMVGMLERLGMRATTATSGAEALAIMAKGGPDLVLMDLRMPGMDGAETTRKLRARGFHGPVIALTADSQAHSRTRCLDAGMDDFLCKPVRMATLAQAVERNELAVA